MLPSVVLYSIKEYEQDIKFTIIYQFTLSVRVRVRIPSEIKLIDIRFYQPCLTISLPHQLISTNSIPLFLLNSNLVKSNEPNTYLRNASINILALWMVDDDSRPRVQNIRSNIIEHKHHNILILQSPFLQQLISMANIGLFSQNSKTPFLQTSN